MKNSLCLILSLLLFAFTGTLARADTALSLTIPSKNGGVGDTLTFPVSLSGNRPLAGFQFRVDYDPVFLELVSASVEVPGGYKIVNKSEGSVEFIWTSASPYTGSGVIAVLSFKLLRQGESLLSPRADSQGGEGFYSYIDGVFYNYAFSVSQARVTCGEKIAGDINGDRILTVSDVTALLDLLSSSGDASCDPDLDGDGAVSISDVSLLLNMLAA